MAPGKREVSRIRVVTSIAADTEKVLDSGIMSKSCKGCTNMERVMSDGKHFTIVT